MEIYIKHMVSLRCKMTVKEELKKLGLINVSVELGTVDIFQDVTENQLSQLKKNLLETGLEVMEDVKIRLVEKIKSAVQEMFCTSEEIPKASFSHYLSNKLGCAYSHLAKVFSEINDITLQQFILSYKIERVKELLLSDSYNLTAISDKMNYSSVAHLSNQFKKTTGLTPSIYRQMNLKM